MDERDATLALAAMRATRGRMAQRARWSLARHAGYGALIGTLIASYALPGQWPMLGLAACLVATAAIIRRDRRRDGFFISGYRRGRTRLLTIVMAAATVLALALAIGLRQRFGMIWAPVAIGAAMTILCTAGSMAWERVYRAELGATGAD